MTMPIDLRPGIRWGRVVLGGLLIELVLMVISVPFIAMGRPEDLPRIVVPATAVAAVVAGIWVARAVSRPVLHGALAGAAAVVLYAMLAVGAALAAPGQADFATALSPEYLASHGLKVLGATAGAWWVARRRGEGA